MLGVPPFSDKPGDPYDNDTPVMVQKSGYKGWFLGPLTIPGIHIQVIMSDIFQ